MLNWSRIWMIGGYPHDLGNLHIYGCLNMGFTVWTLALFDLDEDLTARIKPQIWAALLCRQSHITNKWMCCNTVKKKGICLFLNGAILNKQPSVSKWTCTAKETLWMSIQNSDTIHSLPKNSHEVGLVLSQCQDCEHHLWMLVQRRSHVIPFHQIEVSAVS